MLEFDRGESETAEVYIELAVFVNAVFVNVVTAYVGKKEYGLTLVGELNLEAHGSEVAKVNVRANRDTERDCHVVYRLQREVDLRYRIADVPAYEPAYQYHKVGHIEYSAYGIVDGEFGVEFELPLVVRKRHELSCEVVEIIVFDDLFFTGFVNNSVFRLAVAELSAERHFLEDVAFAETDVESVYLDIHVEHTLVARSAHYYLVTDSPFGSADDFLLFYNLDSDVEARVALIEFVYAVRALGPGVFALVEVVGDNQ